MAHKEGEPDRFGCYGKFGKGITFRPLVSASQALSGMTAGLQVMQSSGTPYNEGFSFNIRGSRYPEQFFTTRVGGWDGAKSE